MSLLAVSIAMLTAMTSLVNPAFAQRDSCCCPIPVGDTGPTVNGRRIPPFVDMYQSLSPDGKKLACSLDETDSIYIIDLATLGQKTVIVQPLLPKLVLAYGNFSWCPYDSDLLAISVLLTDSLYPGLNHYGNIYTYRVSTGECNRITPNIFGPVGDTVELLSLNSWQYNSHSGNDTLEISSWRLHSDSTMLYCPQTQSIIPSPWSGDLRTEAYSRSGLYHLLGYYGQYGLSPYYMNSVSLPLLDSSIELLQWASFSTNEKLLALSVSPNGQGPPADTIFPQVWVYRIDSMAASPIIINFQKSFCMYSFWGIYAEFITDSTLAVSMHKDGDESSPLWEITLDGRIVRQLTFLPESPSGVLQNAPLSNSIRLFPNPANDLLQIMDPESGTIHLFDIMGRERMSATLEGSGTTLDVTHLEPGIYYVTDGSSRAKFVKQ